MYGRRITRKSLKPNLSDIKNADSLTMEDCDGELYASYGRIDDNAWINLYGYEYPEYSETYARALVGDVSENDILTDSQVQQSIYKDMQDAVREYLNGDRGSTYHIYDNNGKSIGFFF